MDKKLFEQKLSEVAEWRYPKIVLDGTEKRRRRGRPSKEESYEMAREQHMYDLYGGVNPTLGPEVTKLKFQPTECPHCHKVVDKQCHIEKRFVETVGKPHWRERCVTCNLWRNPYTGVFDICSSMIGTMWNQYLRGGEEHRKRQKKKMQEQQVIVAQQDFGTETITFYAEKKSSE